MRRNRAVLIIANFQINMSILVTRRGQSTSRDVPIPIYALSFFIFSQCSQLLAKIDCFQSLNKSQQYSIFEMAIGIC